MATYSIYHKNGSKVIDVKKVAQSDSFMGENCVTVGVSSPTVISFAIGDYIDYRGIRFYLGVLPTVQKQARVNSVGNAIVYDSIKFVSAAGYDMTRCEFRDVVLNSSSYYTNFATRNFSVYCESLITFGERLKANLDRICAGGDAWTVKVRYADGTDHTCGTGTAVHANAMGEKGIAITINNETCWDALKHVKDDFGVNFVVRGRTITLGANGSVVAQEFKYGKGNGVFRFERTADDSQAVVTIMRAYGNTTNMPLRYYSKKKDSQLGATINVNNLMLPNFGVKGLHQTVQEVFLHEGYETLTQRIQQAVNDKYGVTPSSFSELNHYVGFSGVEKDPYIVAQKAFALYGTKEGSITFDGSDDNEDIYPSLKWLGDSNKVASVTDGWDGSLTEDNTPTSETFTVSVNLTFNPSRYISYGNDSFTVSMKSGMCAGRDFTCIGCENTTFASIKSQAVQTITGRIYGTAQTGLSGYILKSDNDTNLLVFKVQANDKIRLSGLMNNKNNPSLCWAVYNKFMELKADDEAVGAKLQAAFMASSSDQETVKGRSGVMATVTMPSDASMLVVSVPYTGDASEVEMEGASGLFKLTLQRKEDQSLQLWFPHPNFEVKANDEYVLTDLDMPDEYVDGTALQELLPQAIVATLDNCDTRYKYSLTVDNVQMARQHDEKVAANKPEESIYNSIAAGDELYFSDDDLGINVGHILIDKIDIKEEDGGIPKYEITLVDELSVGTLEAMQKQIDAISNGSYSGGGVNGYTTQDLQRIVGIYGGRLFLSKTVDDTAAGKLTLADGEIVMADTLGTATNYGNSLVRGTSGAGVWYEAGSGWHGQFDFLHVNKKMTATEIEVQKMSHIGGAEILTAAGCNIVATENLGIINSAYYGSVSAIRCFFNATDGDQTISNDWQVRDQARCQTFNMTGNRYWWRVVVGVGTTEDGTMHYIDVCADDTSTMADTGSDYPEAGDAVVLLGSRTGDASRTNAVIEAGAGTGSPYIRMFSGITGFELPTPNVDLNPTDAKLNVKSLTITGENGGTKDVGEIIGDAFDVWYVTINAPTSSDEIVVKLAVGYTGFPAQVNAWTDYAAHLGDIALTADGVCYRLEKESETYWWVRKTDEYLIKALETANINAQALARLASDGVITKYEKQQVKLILTQIVEERKAIYGNASVAGININEYLSAYNLLYAFVNYLCADMSGDTMLINESGQELVAIVSGNSTPTAYTITYQQEGDGINYENALQTYYSALADANKAVTQGVFSKVSSVSETSYDATVKAYVDSLMYNNGLENKIADSIAGNETITNFNSLYNSISSWGWSTDANGNKCISSGGLLTTDNFATLWTSVMDSEHQTIKSALMGVFTYKDENGYMTGAKIAADDIEFTADHKMTIGVVGALTITAGNFKLDANGKMTCVDGEFSGKVTASSGTIGGFAIGSDKLTSSNYNASIEIASASQSVKIGKTATDAITGKSCSMEAKSTSAEEYNTALYLDAKNGTYNYAYHGNGNGVLNGLVCGYATNKIDVDDTTEKSVSLNKGNLVIINYNMTRANEVSIKMPKLSEVRKALCIESNSTPFCVEMTFVCNSATEGWLVKLNGATTTSGSEYPAMMNDAKSVIRGYSLARGNVFKCALLFDGTNYMAIPEFGTGTWIA